MFPIESANRDGLYADAYRIAEEAHKGVADCYVRELCREVADQRHIEPAEVYRMSRRIYARAFDRGAMFLLLVLAALSAGAQEYYPTSEVTANVLSPIYPWINPADFLPVYVSRTMFDPIRLRSLAPPQPYTASVEYSNDGFLLRRTTPLVRSLVGEVRSDVDFSPYIADPSLSVFVGAPVNQGGTWYQPWSFNGGTVMLVAGTTVPEPGGLVLAVVGILLAVAGLVVRTRR